MKTLQRSELTYITILSFFVLTGCAALGLNNLDKMYGEAKVKNRLVASLPDGHVDYWQTVKPILDGRCVVCHGCYDAPCQLKLTAVEGIERGASDQNIYDTGRFLHAPLTRLFTDANSTQQWREKGFFPVLNEREQSRKANIMASPLYQLLEQKQDYPLPDTKILGEDFTFGVSRKQVCPNSDDMDHYLDEHPLWGMPYATPGLNKKEYEALTMWIEQGAIYTPRAGLPPMAIKAINMWEAFLNQDTIKSKLVSRYIYEHLFLTSLYFPELSNRETYRLVRSTTPTGEPVDEVATRRPYDDPQTEHVYYRIVPNYESTVAKTHMPYALNDDRMSRWKSLFFETPYTVDDLPGYNAEVAANPFKSFRQLPVRSRYEFMLDEAQITIMNYIKGPVCRGSVALNVIRDHFWVFFIDPDVQSTVDITEFLAENSDLLELPSVEADTFRLLKYWREYKHKEQALMKAKDAFFTKNNAVRNRLDLNLIWDGDNKNTNASLTIFRHFDSATVERGMIGDFPQTAWLIGYPLLERIHYLLVAGYDVYGNLGHQLLSRKHMDFLRMEGEANFLNLLPKKTRDQERVQWYRGAEPELLEFLIYPHLSHARDSAIKYTGNNHKHELFDMLRSRLGTAVETRRGLETLNNGEVETQLKRLASFAGEKTRLLSEVSLIEIVDEHNKNEFFTLLRNNAHLSMTSMFQESAELAPEENTVTVARGIVGAYPNTFLRVYEGDLATFVEAIVSLSTPDDYEQLLDNFGIRRTAAEFWAYSDHVHQWFNKNEPVEYGILDYNRLENR